MRSRADIDQLRATDPALAGLSDYDLMHEPEATEPEPETETPAKAKRGKSTPEPDEPDTE